MIGEINMAKINQLGLGCMGMGRGIAEIERAFPADKVKGTGMPPSVCRNGKLVRDNE